MSLIKNIVFLLVFLHLGIVGVSQSNSLKIGLLGASIGDYSLSLEQVIHTTHSMNLNIGVWDLSTGLINIDYFLRGEDKLWVNDAGSDWHASLEMRNYFSLGYNEEKNPFYWGPYIRYWKANMLLNDYIKNDFVQEQQLFNAQVKFNGIGVGFQIGYQLMIGDRFWLDFYFVGLGVERIKMNAIYRANGVDDFNYDAIKDDVINAFRNQPKFIRDNVQVNAYNELLRIDLPFVIPSYRGGINLAFILD